MIVAVNGLVLDLVLALRSHAGRAAVLAGIGIAGVVVATAVTDLARFEPTTTGHLRVAMLQGDDEELPLAQQTDQPLTDKHFALADSCAATTTSSCSPSRRSTPIRSTTRRCGRGSPTSPRAHGANVLVNARTPGSDDQSRNTNLMYTPDGKLQGVYSKQHLVPFGEYVPWRDELSFIRELRQIPYDFEPGDSRTMFHVAGHPLGVVICFESAFGPLVRDSVRDGARGDRGEHQQPLVPTLGQHRAAPRARARCAPRRPDAPVLQASVSGISAVIDPDGSVHDRTKLFESAVVTASVPTTTGETLYVRFGDWVVLLSALAVVGVTIVAVRRPVTTPGA